MMVMHAGSAPIIGPKDFTHRPRTDHRSVQSRPINTTGRYLGATRTRIHNMELAQDVHFRAGISIMLSHDLCRPRRLRRAGTTQTRLTDGRRNDDVSGAPSLCSPFREHGDGSSRGRCRDGDPHHQGHHLVDAALLAAGYGRRLLRAHLQHNGDRLGLAPRRLRCRDRHDSARHHRSPHPPRTARVARHRRPGDDGRGSHPDSGQRGHARPRRLHPRPVLPLPRRVEPRPARSSSRVPPLHARVRDRAGHRHRRAHRRLHHARAVRVHRLLGCRMLARLTTARPAHAGRTV